MAEKANTYSAEKKEKALAHYDRLRLEWRELQTTKLPALEKAKQELDELIVIENLAALNKLAPETIRDTDIPVLTRLAAEAKTARLALSDEEAAGAGIARVKSSGQDVEGMKVGKNA